MRLDDLTAKSSDGSSPSTPPAPPKKRTAKSAGSVPLSKCPAEVQGELNVDATPSSRFARSASSMKRDEGVASTIKQPWPVSLPDQVRLLRAALALNTARAAEELARSFVRAQTNRVTDLLETLTDLGQARKLSDDRYTTG